MMAVASVNGAIESIVCSRWIGSDGVTLYIDWRCVDGSPGQRFAHFDYRSPTSDGDIWSETFTAIAFDQSLPHEPVIPILCEVSFCQDRDMVSARLRVISGGIFPLPVHDYRLT
jgi:hypothetical protein